MDQLICITSSIIHSNNFASIAIGAICILCENRICLSAVLYTHPAILEIKNTYTSIRHSKKPVIDLALLDTAKDQPKYFCIFFSPFFLSFLFQTKFTTFLFWSIKFFSDDLQDVTYDMEHINVLRRKENFQQYNPLRHN